MASVLGCTVAEAQDRVSSDEFNGWRAYWIMYGEPDPWQQASLIASAVIGAAGGEHGIQIESRRIGSHEYQRVHVDSFVGRRREWTPESAQAMIRERSALDGGRGPRPGSQNSRTKRR